MTTTKPELHYRTSYDLRATADADGAEVSGYVSTFWAVDSYLTAMAPGAFTKTLAERGDRLPLLYQHNPHLNIGVPTESAVDARGLKATAKIFDDGAEGSAISARLRQGARYGFSFGFQTISTRAATETDPLDLAQAPYAGLTYNDVMIITEVKLYEYSIVTFPANELATIDTVRQAAQLDAMRSLLVAVRDNTLTDHQRAALDELVAAYSAAAPSGTDQDTHEPEIARRRLDVDLALANATLWLAG